jgi:UDP-glucose 4-epimerase
LRVYGRDYDTPDGTAVRDYVHVADVASAHLDAVNYLRGGGSSVVLNCGYGEGVSVQDVVQAVERVTGKPLELSYEGRREGDPPQLIADTGAIRSVLGWRPHYNDLDLIVRTAIEWERRHGAGELENA